MEAKYSYTVQGASALFTDPITRGAGSHETYPLPTYEALRGLSDAIYWKPSITHVIDRVRVMNKIKTFTKGGVITVDNKPKRIIHKYLRDVAYQIEGHIELNLNQIHMKDFDLKKHWHIMQESIQMGGRMNPFLGTSECIALVESCEFGEGSGFYDNIDSTFGLMFHSFEYPNITGKNEFAARLWIPTMVNGIIEFPRTLETSHRQFIRSQGPYLNPEKVTHD